MKDPLVMSVFGTRPEAVKMCPLVKELKRRRGLECSVVLTGQHREMTAAVMREFGVDADFDLDIMRPAQSPSGVMAEVLTRLDGVLAETAPDMVLVHGDTTTSVAAAIAAFHRKIPVGHVEAGLRTHNKYFPFPEEMNRTITSKIASLHFAPTEENRRNLLAEGVDADAVFVTGNTVIDALGHTIRVVRQFDSPKLRTLDFTRGPVVTLTAHRRENHGAGLESVCRAVLKLTEKYGDLTVVYPVHPSPDVTGTVTPLLSGRERVVLTEPLSVSDMHNLIARSYFVMTDSGGIQEEAPLLGVPVLVLRRETERPEAVEAGCARVVGVECGGIVAASSALLDSEDEHRKMASAKNPYGDGNASARIADAVISYFQNKGEKKK